METVKVNIAIPSRFKRATLKRKRRESQTKPLSDFPTSPDISDISGEEETGQDSATDSLTWRPVARSQIRAGFDDTAVLAFEEIDNVDVQYDDAPGGGRVAKLVKMSAAKINEAVARHPAKKARVYGHNDIAEFLADDFNAKENLPEWSAVLLLPVIKRTLHSLSFSSPTEIQSRSLPHALEGKDIVGVAETGSGKTLAYGLPIIHRILSSASSTESFKRRIKALILAPTRELALQVSDHLNAVVPKPLTALENGDSKKPPPAISVAAIVGGMSLHKQKRVLERGVDVLIATPGRLWDIIQEDDEIAGQIRDLQFLVLDEADRMIEAGHFQELENIVKLTLRPGRSDDGVETEKGAEFSALEKQAGIMSIDRESNESLQTFVFSATLSKELQRNLKRKTKKPLPKKSKKSATTLDDLLLRLDFRDPDPEVIDLSPEGGAVSTLQEGKIECMASDKDLYLYYFLLRYPGRTLIFVSSIDGIRRVIPLLEILQLEAFPLHSQLQQRQRLRNLERFKESHNAVLVATDVAARGLDIPDVDHVVHYQMPRSADVYVHRNGRTARAKREGFSLQLRAPDERKVSRALLHSLDRKEDVPDFSVDHDLMSKLKERLALAKQIDNAQHNVKKENHERKWLEETAEALELDLDPEILGRSKTDKSGQQHGKVAGLKARLGEMLAQPLVSRGISLRYLTSGSRPLVDDLIVSSGHQTMLGVNNHAAKKDIVAHKRKKAP